MRYNGIKYFKWLKHFLFGSLILLLFFIYFIAIIAGSFVLVVTSLIMLGMSIKASEDVDKMLI